jgi:AcrR family transcriptional regulator
MALAPAVEESPSAHATPSVRDRVLDTAATLFYRDGIHAVGVDAIVAASGVAKMSFYRHFPSKDDLIRAVLEEHDRRYWVWWDEALALHPGDPRRQLADLFDVIADRLRRPSYRGCAFINFTAEFAQAAHPGYDVVTTHKRQQRERLRALTAGLGVADSELLADHLVLLIEGARVSAITLGDTGPAQALPRAAESLIAANVSAGARAS